MAMSAQMSLCELEAGYPCLHRTLSQPLCPKLYSSGKAEAIAEAKRSMLGPSVFLPADAPFPG